MRWSYLAVFLALGGSAAMAQDLDISAVSYCHALDSMEDLEVQARKAEIVYRHDGSALLLDGMILVPDLIFSDVGMEVEIFADSACYPGIAFRVQNQSNYELAYIVPHVSGQVDAIQYDPVFRNSNTWQLFTGPAYQKSAKVSFGRWHRLRLDVAGDKAIIRVDEQDPLVVEQLAREPVTGQVGIWTFRPALFRNLKVGPPRLSDHVLGKTKTAPDHVISDWWLEGVGTITTDPSGIVNLNRFLDPREEPAVLKRTFHQAEAGTLTFGFGFSDAIVLKIDGDILFEGTHKFSGFDSIETRGWVDAASHRISTTVTSGQHELEVSLKVTEPFGWGFAIAMEGKGISFPELLK